MRTLAYERQRNRGDSNLARVLAGKAVLTGQIWEMLYRRNQISTWVGEKAHKNEESEIQHLVF